MQRFVRLALLLVVLQAAQIGGQNYKRCDSNANTKRKLVNLIDPNVLSCPPLGDDDDRYCCYLPGRSSYYCCDAKDFIEETGIGFLLPLLVSMVVAMMIMCCVCCVCCPCCCWYKKRNRGAVYNTVTLQREQQPEAPPVPQHGPHSTVYQQQQYPYPQQHAYQPPAYPMMAHQNYPMMHPQEAYPPAVPPHATAYPPAVPPHAGQPMPPPYSEAKTAEQPYTRQAPFNPNF